jgi:hypothetical protein
MNVRMSRVVLALGAALAAVVGSGASVAVAAPVPVKVELNSLHCMKTYAVDLKADDEAYFTVTGVAKGADVNKRVPESGAAPANKKKPVVTEKEPVALWEGELADGEFALLTFTLYHGTGEDAGKAFAAKLAEAAKGVAERSKPTLTAEEAKALPGKLLAAQRPVVTAVKETLSRDKKTDHFGGLFNVLVWNNAGTIVKRLDPVGLTFGEHYGTKEKVYTKIKYTLNDVNFPDESGEWYPKQMPPVSEDKLTVYVKMLENDVVLNARGKQMMNTTDYLAGVRVHAAGKPAEWKLGQEVLKPGLEQSLIHIFWEWAE